MWIIILKIVPPPPLLIFLWWGCHATICVCITRATGSFVRVDLSCLQSDHQVWWWPAWFLTHYLLMICIEESLGWNGEARTLIVLNLPSLRRWSSSPDMTSAHLDSSSHESWADYPTYIPFRHWYSFSIISSHIILPSFFLSAISTCCGSFCETIESNYFTFCTLLIMQRSHQWRISRSINILSDDHPDDDDERRRGMINLYQ